jgi:hypothetical protein
MEFEGTLLQELLENIITKGLPAWFIFQVLKQPFAVRWFEKIQPWIERNFAIAIGAFKRFVAFIGGTVLSLGFYYAYAAFGYASIPQGAEEILNVIIHLGTITFATSQAFHALSKKRTYIK